MYIPPILYIKFIKFSPFFDVFELIKNSYELPEIDIKSKMSYKKIVIRF